MMEHGQSQCGVTGSWHPYSVGDAGREHCESPRSLGAGLQCISIGGLKNMTMMPGLVWFSGLSAGLRTKGSPVRFPVRTHAWVVGQVPSRGCARGNHTLTFLSLFLLPFPSLKIMTMMALCLCLMKISYCVLVQDPEQSGPEQSGLTVGSE